jgi:hypothetical protein
LVFVAAARPFHWFATNTNFKSIQGLVIVRESAMAGAAAAKIAISA